MPTVSARKKRPKPSVTDELSASSSSCAMLRSDDFFVTSYLSVEKEREHRKKTRVRSVWGVLPKEKKGGEGEHRKTRVRWETGQGG